MNSNWPQPDGRFVITNVPVPADWYVYGKMGFPFSSETVPVRRRRSVADETAAGISKQAIVATTKYNRLRMRYM